MTTATLTSELKTRLEEIDRLLGHCYPRPTSAELHEIAKLYEERWDIKCALNEQDKRDYDVREQPQ